MRKRKLIITMVAALAVSVGLAAVAQAVVTSQTITTSQTKTKQDRKTPGAADILVDIDTFETPPTPAAQTAEHTDVDFDKDYVFSAGKLAQCTAGQLAGTNTAAARAACGASEVGSGTAILCSAAGGCGALSVPVTVTAFNGVPIAGNQVIYLHAKPNGIAEANPPLILTGQLIPSPLGAPYGKRLSVDVPDTSSTGLHLTEFKVNVGVLRNGVVKKVKNKNKVKKCKKIKNKKKRSKCLKKSKKKVPQFYVMSRCSDRQWDFRSETRFRGGAATQIDTHTNACTQKKVKKKKKKKKK